MSRDKFLRSPSPSFWQLQAMGWLGFYLLGVVGSIPELLRRPSALYHHTVGLGFMFLASCALRPVCRSLLQRSRSWQSFELQAAVWSVVAGAFSAFATELALMTFYTRDWSFLTTLSVQYGFVLFFWCSLYFSIKQWQQSTLEKERLLRAETDAREARLRALRYQLNPHFLFNSLNAVSTLVLDGNARGATQMLAQIGELLRASLDDQAKPEVALSQEIALTQRYFAIEQTRLGDRLRVDWSIAADTLDAQVPSMLLQPLVENAVLHGVAPLVEGGMISIESEVQHGRLQIAIRNSGQPDGGDAKGRGNGIGLTNTAERLKTLYGTDYKLLLEWPKEGGCEVTVDLPFRKAPRPPGTLPCAR